MDSLASSSRPKRAAMAKPRSGEVLLSTEGEEEEEVSSTLTSVPSRRTDDLGLKDSPESCIRDTTSKTSGSW